MFQPNFDPAPTAVRIHRCGYVSRCTARGCLKRATLIAEKVDGAGRHVRQIELCLRHCQIVIERERSRALENLRSAERIVSEKLWVLSAVDIGPIAPGFLLSKPFC